jgi:hypothetical protein
VERLHGKLCDGERVLFGRVSVAFEGRDERGNRLGRLEVHEGSAPFLVISRPYRLALDDGRTEEVFITGLRQSGLAGIIILTMRTSAGVMAEKR